MADGLMVAMELMWMRLTTKYLRWQKRLLSDIYDNCMLERPLDESGGAVLCRRL